MRLALDKFFAKYHKVFVCISIISGFVAGIKLFGNIE